MMPCSDTLFLRAAPSPLSHCTVPGGPCYVVRSMSVFMYILSRCNKYTLMVKKIIIMKMKK